MTRWWDDSRESLAALGNITEGDVRVNVAAAALGYHGIAAAVIKPLSERTLVDAAAVQDALSTVDLAPVAKALAVATRPVMGDAADRYGEQLALDFHEQAVESTTRLLTSLTNTGMDWPTAVSRAAGVHGVPVDRLGIAGKRLREPRMPVVTQQDWSDRALMDYVSHVGRREEIPFVEPVAKAGRPLEFDPSDHPRGPDGKFTDKSLKGLSEREREFLAFRERRDRRERRDARDAQIVQARQAPQEVRQEAKSKPLASLAAMLAAKPTERIQASQKPAVREQEQDPMVARVEAKMEENLDAHRDAVISRHKAEIAESQSKGLSVPKGVDPSRDLAGDDDPDETFSGHVEGVGGQRFVLIPTAAAAAVEKSRIVNIGQLNKLCGMNLEAFSRSGMQDLISDYGNNAIEELSDRALMIIDGPVAFGPNSGAHDVNAVLNTHGVYRVEGLTDAAESGLQYGNEHGLVRRTRNAGFTREVPFDMPHITVRLQNDHQFEYREGGSPTRKLGIHDLPFDRWRDDFGFDNASKAWDEREHLRDADGKFTDMPERGRSMPDDYRAYMERKAMRARREEKDREVTRMREAPAFVREKTVSLADMLAAKPRQDRQADVFEGQVVDSRVDDAMAARADDVMAARVERAMLDKMEQAKAIVQGRAARDEAVRESFGGDLKAMDALHFSGEDDAGSFMTMFNIDPDTGVNMGLTDDFAGDYEEVLSYWLSERLKPLTNIADSMDAAAVKRTKKSGPGIVWWDEYEDSALGAEEIAMSNILGVADNDSATTQWMPMSRFVPEKKAYQLGRHAVPLENHDILVVGKKEDWAAMENAEDWTIEPLAVDWKSSGGSQTRFNTIFWSAASDESQDRMIRQGGRSDFYVRAFRVRKRQNGLD